MVEADGTVRPCFFQPPLGNLRKEAGLAAILNSNAAIDWRRGLDTSRDAICRRCVCSLALREGGGVKRHRIVLYNPRAVFFTMPLALVAVGSHLDPNATRW